LFSRYYVTDSPVANEPDEDERENIICRFTRTDRADESKCIAILSETTTTSTSAPPPTTTTTAMDTSENDNASGDNGSGAEKNLGSLLAMLVIVACNVKINW
jgi:hypothetical protein